MIEAFLVLVERHQHRKDRMPVLAGGDAAGGEALAVANAVDVVDQRHLRVAGQDEIGVHRMRRAARIDGSHGSHQRLPDHLTPVDALPARLRRAAPEQVHLERLEIEDVEEVFDGGWHGSYRIGRMAAQPAMLGLH